MIEGSSIALTSSRRCGRWPRARRACSSASTATTPHEHVFAELEAYAPLTTVGSYCVVFDTVVEELPKALSGDRPWGPGDNPMTAARRYLRSHPEFAIDERIDHKLLIGVAPKGYLRRVR